MAGVHPPKWREYIRQNGGQVKIIPYYNNQSYYSEVNVRVRDRHKKEDIKLRRTHTSTEVKNRWNKKHYDQIAYHCKIGGKEYIKQLAAASGKSMADYLRTLVIQDAQKKGRNDIVEFFGGGV